MKVQDIARELNISPKEFLGFLKDQGIRVKNASVKLDPGTVTRVKNMYHNKQKQAQKTIEPLPEKNVSIKEESVKVSQITQLFDIPLSEIMKIFLKKGLLVNVNSEIDQETLVEVGKELNVTVDIEDMTSENELGLKTKVMEIEESSSAKEAASMTNRPPVIAIMGHVDHGKTMLLDKIRKSRVIEGEAGGITQHIGAYQVEANNMMLTFLDTPGHEAFTSLRARGAQITDIAILVVAADEGIKPQTIEALNHAQVADVPIIVAINKMDKPEADPEKVKQQLSQYNLLSEDWGGDTVMVPVSAKSGEGIDSLLEMIQLVSEMQELKSPVSGTAKGVVIESNLSAQKGPIATVIIKAGTLKVGDFFIIDGSYGKVRAIINDLGKKIKHLKPGDPGEILGFSEVPRPGGIIESKLKEKECKEYIESYKIEKSQRKSTQKMAVSLEALSSQAEEGNLRELNLIIKADVNGSLEAIKSSIEKIESQDIPIKIIHASTGSITENDVMLAKASNGIVFGFNSDANNEAKKVAEAEKIIVKSYSIIYEILDNIERVIKGLYKPEFEEIEMAQLEVRQLFKFSKVGIIAGCYVTSGKIDRNCKVKVLRGNNEEYNGDIDSLKRFKEDVKEISHGFECGVVLSTDNIKEGDIIYAYKIQEKKVI